VLDVGAYVRQQRAALMAHRTQVRATDWFVRLPAAAYDEVFGVECFERVRGPGPGQETDLFDGLEV